MRLRETRELLKKHSHLITYSYEQTKSGEYKVSGLQKAINAIDNLSSLGIFEKDINRLKRFPSVYYTKNNDDIIRIPEQVHIQVLSVVSTVKEKVDDYQKLISYSIPEQNENVISVKLPQYEDLKDLSKFFKDLDTALHTGLVTKGYQDDYELQNFDTGSLWVDIFMISSAAVGFLGEIVTTAVNIKGKIQEFQIMQNQIDHKLDMSEEQKQNIKFLREILEQQMNTIIEAEIKMINGNKEIDKEGLSQMRTSVKMIADLINKGTQFHSPLDAPPEVQQAFPKPATQEALQGPQSLLEQTLSYLEGDEQDSGEEE